jgi:hypothetical protein
MKFARLFICLTTIALPAMASAADLAPLHHRSSRTWSEERYAVRRGCPAPFTCSSLYGAYGPFGDYRYWTEFSNVGRWRAVRPAIVLRSRG